MALIMKQYTGTFTAIITPFNEDGHLDESGLKVLIKRQIDASVDGIIVLGTTGESPTLTSEEQLKILNIAKEACQNQTKLIIGTGTNSTLTTIENTKYAENFGADAALLISPYYNRPTQEGLYQHFKAVANATTIPLILYNNPVRTGQNIQTDTFKRLLDLPNIVGIKECSENITELSDKIEIARNYRPDFCILTGNDPHILTLMTLGGHGVISAASNVIPKEIISLVKCLLDGDLESAKEQHYALMPLMRELFLETNPISIKAALNILGLPAGDCRLPLCGQHKNLEKMKACLHQVLKKNLAKTACE